MHPDLDRIIEIARQAEGLLGSHRKTFAMAAMSATNGMLNALHAVEQDIGLRRIMADVERSRELARFAVGPLEELRRAAEHGYEAISDRQRSRVRSPLHRLLA